jgi:hypothetical protein
MILKATSVLPTFTKPCIIFLPKLFCYFYLFLKTESALTETDIGDGHKEVISVFKIKAFIPNLYSQKTADIVTFKVCSNIFILEQLDFCIKISGCHAFQAW